MHPLRYTLYKILDGKKLRALSFHGRSQTMYTGQYSRVSLTISLSIYIFSIIIILIREEGMPYLSIQVSFIQAYLEKVSKKG